jgi:hypothetical protein
VTNDNGDTRQERREKKRRKKKEKIPQHGRSLWQIYRDAIEKRRREKEGE